MPSVYSLPVPSSSSSLPSSICPNIYSTCISSPSSLCVLYFCHLPLILFHNSNIFFHSIFSCFFPPPLPYFLIYTPASFTSPCHYSHPVCTIIPQSSSFSSPIFPITTFLRCTFIISYYFIHIVHQRLYPLLSSSLSSSHGLD
jgi:hypothetical protein